MVACSFEVVTNSDVNQQIDLPRHANVADFEVGAAVSLTRENSLVRGGETGVMTNTLQTRSTCSCALVQLAAW